MDDVQLEDRIARAVEERITPLLDKLKEALKGPQQEWFSIEQASVLTGLSPDHVRQHVTAGMLPVSNMGTFEKPYYRIHRKDIDEWMAKRREAPNPAPRRKKADPGPGSYVSRHHKQSPA
jgi:excisionase family DNA binding protein